MNQHDIHEIIEQISQTLDCPQCKNKILPHNIVITDIVGADCTFDVRCERCETEMTLSAHIEKTTVDEAKTHNRSSQMLHDQLVDEPISEEDVQTMKYELAHFCGSFIETFCRS
jgi:DNA-directed RNA polymerase subunit M/transcription elongation factor TFIIS